jgi:serine/threonine protein kinase
MGLGYTVRILSLICHALEHAHKVTIHRDISPENVMVMPNGDVKLLDFGLAKITTMDSNLTRIGVSLGKIQYSAPEQRMDAKNVDHRTDIYSLGVMFFEMLSGQLPLGSSNLRSLAKDLPPEVDHLVAKTIAPDPEERYDSAEEFRLALLNTYQRSTGKGIKVISEEAHVEEVAQEEQQMASEEPNADDTLPIFTAMQDNRNIFMHHYYKIKIKFFGQPNNFDNTFNKN